VTAISRLPAGLLGFLGIKNSGRNPQMLVSQLNPVWDISRLYLDYAAEYERAAGTITATGYLATLQAPIGEVWYITDACVDVATPAGTTWTGAFSRSGAVVADNVNISNAQSLAASSWTTFVPAHTWPLILSPGESIGVLTDQVGANPVDWVCKVRVAKLTM
jgi:hypothetical protein